MRLDALIEAPYGSWSIKIGNEVWTFSRMEPGQEGMFRMRGPVKDRLVPGWCIEWLIEAGIEVTHNQVSRCC